MSGIEAATELDRLRRELETVQGGSAIKSERLYELAETCATLRARAERAEAGIVKANSQAEEFERRYYLEKNALEAAQSTIAELTGQVERLTEERDIAQEYLAGVLSVNPNVPDCIDNHDRAYQSQGLANWGAAQLAAFRAALGGEKSTAPAFTLPPETPPPE